MEENFRMALRRINSRKDLDRGSFSSRMMHTSLCHLQPLRTWLLKSSNSMLPATPQKMQRPCRGSGLGSGLHSFLWQSKRCRLLEFGEVKAKYFSLSLNNVKIDVLILCAGAAFSPRSL